MKIEKIINSCLEYISERNYRMLLFFLGLAILLNPYYLFTDTIWHTDFSFYLQGAKVCADGGVLYRDYGDIKPPGIFMFYYAIIRIFGYMHVEAVVKLITIFFVAVAAFLLARVCGMLSKGISMASIGIITVLAVSIKIDFEFTNIMFLSLVPAGLYLYLLALDNFSLKPGPVFFAGIICGILFLLSTNMIFFSLVIPAMVYYMKRDIFYTGYMSLLGGIGFFIPVMLNLWYIYHNNAFADFYWWNIQWGAIYGGNITAIFRVLQFIFSLIKTWEWAPLYVPLCMFVYSVLRSRDIKQPAIFFTILVVFVSILCRLPLRKSAERYNLYLLPAFIICIPFFNWSEVRKYVKYAVIVFVITGFIVNGYLSIQDRSKLDDLIVADKPLIEWIKENSSPSDKIYVWEFGSVIYTFAERSMATSFFSAGEHLDNYKIWIRNNYKDIEKPWERFMGEFDRDKPLFFIDLSGNFYAFDDKYRGEPLRYYVEKFKRIIERDYIHVKNFNNISVWKRKQTYTAGIQ